jgi:FkbM family methyltransferase
MLSSFSKSNNITITGILHVGANVCEEYNEYKKLTDNIIYIEANPEIVKQVKLNLPEINIHQALITDEDNTSYEFKISSNNGQSSSILDFNLHKVNHPSVSFIDKIQLESITIDNFITKNGIDKSNINALVLDIQGVELKALKGSKELLKNINIIYTEVNIDDTYTGCDRMKDIDEFLYTYGFKCVNIHIFHGHTYGDAVYIKQ